MPAASYASESRSKISTISGSRSRSRVRSTRLAQEPRTNDLHRHRAVDERISAQRKVGAWQEALRESLAKHFHCGDGGLVVELHLAIRDDCATAGAGEIQRIEIVEALEPGGLE